MNQLGDGFQELAWPHFECSSQGNDIQEHNVPFPALDATDVVAVEVREFSQLLLGQTPKQNRNTRSMTLGSVKNSVARFRSCSLSSNVFERSFIPIALRLVTLRLRHNQRTGGYHLRNWAVVAGAPTTLGKRPPSSSDVFSLARRPGGNGTMKSLLSSQATDRCWDSSPP